MASGVTIPDSIKALFNEMKLRHTYKYAMLNFSDDLKSIELVKSYPDMDDSSQSKGGGEEDVFDLLKEQMRSHVKTGGYIFYDFEYEGRKSKLFVITWSDDNQTPTKRKMMLSASKAALKSKLEGFIELTINDLDEFEKEALRAKIKE